MCWKPERRQEGEEQKIFSPGIVLNGGAEYGRSNGLTLYKQKFSPSAISQEINKNEDQNPVRDAPVDPEQEERGWVATIFDKESKRWIVDKFFKHKDEIPQEANFIYPAILLKW